MYLFFTDILMKKFDLEIALITPISDTPLKLNFFYKKTLCHEYWFMPWETGLSKTMTFPIHLLDNLLDLQDFEAQTNDENNVIFESIKLNGEVQKLSALRAEEKLKLSVQQALKIETSQFSVVKLSDLPNDAKVSYAYNCNNSIYIPGCDAERAIIEFASNNKVQFTAELFKANVVEAEKELLCSFDGQMVQVEEKIKVAPASTHGSHDARSLRNSLAEHFEVSQENTQNNAQHDHAAPIVDIQNAQNSDIETITNAIKNAAGERYYSVIKLCGLPKNAFENNVFYNDGAHFLTKETVSNLEFKSLKNLKGKTEITVHFFGENTETPLKTLILHLENKVQKPARIKASRQRKKSA